MVFIVSIFMIFILFAWVGAEIGTKLWSWNALIIFLVSLWPTIIILSELAMMPIYIFNTLWNKIIQIKDALNDRKNYIWDLKELVSLINTLHNLMKKILCLKKTFLFFLTKKTNKQIKTYFQMVQENILNILKELKYELEMEISIRNERLTQAKFDLSQNLTGTPELLAVSEAQKIRLDKQIEEFEELQKRLAGM